jgi:hypothetical protein
VLPRALAPVAASARITGEIFWFGASHDGVDRHLLDRVLPVLAEMRSAHVPDHFVRLATGVGQHGRHALFGGQDDRQVIGPEIVLEQAVQVLLGIGFHQPGGRALERDLLQILVVEGHGEPLDHLPHHGPTRDGVVAVDIGAQLLGRLAHHGLRHKHLPHAWHAVKLRH